MLTRGKGGPLSKFVQESIPVYSVYSACDDVVIAHIQLGAAKWQEIEAKSDNTGPSPAYIENIHIVHNIKTTSQLH